MEKKLEKKRKEILKATEEQRISKAVYDSQVLILEARRKEVESLTTYNQKLSDEYVAAVNRVNELMNEENKIMQELEEQTKQQETKVLD